MNNQDSLVVDGVSLDTSLLVSDKEISRLLILSGGANLPLNKSPYPKLQKELLELGITSLAFSYRGVGDGKLNQTSLNTRHEDAREALRFLNRSHVNAPCYVMGISMGAPLAIELAVVNNLDGLILISPAAYSLDARNKNFGQEFSKAIRVNNNWDNSPDFVNLKRYRGRTLYIYGSYDDVIPKDVLSEYARIIQSLDGGVVKVEAGHRFFRAMGDQDKKAEIQFRKLLKQFLLEA